MSHHDDDDTPEPALEIAWRTDSDGGRWHLTERYGDLHVSAKSRPLLLMEALMALADRLDTGLRNANVIHGLIDAGRITDNGTQERGHVNCRDLQPVAMAMVNAVYDGSNLIPALVAMWQKGEFEPRSAPEPEPRLAAQDLPS